MKSQNDLFVVDQKTGKTTVTIPCSDGIKLTREFDDLGKAFVFVLGLRLNIHTVGISLGTFIDDLGITVSPNDIKQILGQAEPLWEEAKQQFLHHTK